MDARGEHEHACKNTRNTCMHDATQLRRVLFITFLRKLVICGYENIFCHLMRIFFNMNVNALLFVVTCYGLLLSANQTAFKFKHVLFVWL